ncbi:hypothetical protein CBFG_03172 [Clostridiales bacterium 1_7_47FAA]|nr:hypothetical protein CBFG_03172 [Clostridiales bacterium 1_7_47FAA]
MLHFSQFTEIVKLRKIHLQNTSLLKHLQGFCPAHLPAGQKPFHQFPVPSKPGPWLGAVTLSGSGGPS